MPSIYKNSKFITVKQTLPQDAAGRLAVRGVNGAESGAQNGAQTAAQKNFENSFEKGFEKNGVPRRPVLLQGARSIPNGEKMRGGSVGIEEASHDSQSAEAEEALSEEPLQSREEVIAEYERLRDEYVGEGERAREEALRWAEEYTANAKSEIEKLYAEAAKDIEEKKIIADKNGYEEGYERGLGEGREKGFDDGYAKGLRKCKDTLKVLMDGLAEIPAQKDVIFKKYERELFDAAFTIANKVTHESLKQKDKAVIQKMLRKAARGFRNSEYIKVTLSKLDVEQMGEAELDSLKEIFRENQHIEFEISKDAPEGTLILDNGSEITDASVATQLMMIEKLGKGKFRDKPAEENEIE